MSYPLGIASIVVGAIATGLAFFKAPGKAKLRLQLFILGPVLLIVGILIVIGII